MQNKVQISKVVLKIYGNIRAWWYFKYRMSQLQTEYIAFDDWEYINTDNLNHIRNNQEQYIPSSPDSYSSCCNY